MQILTSTLYDKLSLISEQLEQLMDASIDAFPTKLKGSLVLYA